jgi:uncharacterized small protein (DUF1192 family)
MDWEDLKPKPKREIIVGEKLEGLSVGELKERISGLTAEIARVELELAAKEKPEAAARSLFKD